MRSQLRRREVEKRLPLAQISTPNGIAPEGALVGAVPRAEPPGPSPPPPEGLVLLSGTVSCELGDDCHLVHKQKEMLVRERMLDTATGDGLQGRLVKGL